MRRKHFEQIAKILRKQVQMNGDSKEAVVQLADRFADYFGTDNPRFSRSRFIKASLNYT